jgi:hypothetical protein
MVNLPHGGRRHIQTQMRRYEPDERPEAWKTRVALRLQLDGHRWLCVNRNLQILRP